MEVRPLAAPSAPEVVLLVLDCPIGMVFLLLVGCASVLFWWEKKGVLEVLVSIR